MIVATAGHVDHGKTTLVKALTGVDADRLPEEKARGLTIDLGFAYSGELGFVDVPGHERFLHNMLAGVSGVDLALLVVAADDGPMPQTHEHLAILRLLGVPQLAVAVTKVDRVPPARVAEVAAEAGALTPGAAQFRVSCVRGDGVEALRVFLSGRAQLLRGRAARGNFRLSVDRAFTLPGAGLVVTGTAMSGSITTGDQVQALIAGTAARVRGLHAQNAPVRRGSAGQRLALNLAGLEGKAAIARGDWIVARGAPAAVRRFDARLACVAGPIRHGTPVHLHIGAVDVLARIAVLEGKAIGEKDEAWVQVLAEKPVGAACGDRFIVRDASARRTLGGGSVVDVFAPARGRSKPARLAWLEAMATCDDAAALAALAERSPGGVDMARFAANRNLPAAAGWRFSPRHWHALREKALAELAAWHASAPDGGGMPDNRLVCGLRLAREAAAQLIGELAAERRIVRHPRGLRLATHVETLNAADAQLWKRIRPLLEEGGRRPPTVSELAEALRLERGALEKSLGRLAQLCMVVRVSTNRYFLPGIVKQLEGMVVTMEAATAAAFRDRAGIGRGLAIEVLEFFDRTRLTRRVGDAHVVRRS
jgi:selenocysteine-specific elongation factor